MIPTTPPSHDNMMDTTEEESPNSGAHATSLNVKKKRSTVALFVPPSISPTASASATRKRSNRRVRVYDRGTSTSNPYQDINTPSTPLRSSPRHGPKLSPSTKTSLQQKSKSGAKGGLREKKATGTTTPSPKRKRMKNPFKDFLSGEKKLTGKQRAMESESQYGGMGEGSGVDGEGQPPFRYGDRQPQRGPDPSERRTNPTGGGKGKEVDILGGEATEIVAEHFSHPRAVFIEPASDDV